MTKQRKLFAPISLVAIAAVTLFLFSCKFPSFAESQKSTDKKVTFGSTEKPNIKVPAQFAGFKSVFADVAEKVLPTVVSITSTTIDTVETYNRRNPLQEFFGFPSPYQERREPGEKREQRRSGSGSGVIVSKDGYILTNYHVVGKADEIIVETYDEREYEAEIVGVDSLSDVAVIKIKESEGVDNLPAAYLGDSSKLRPGDWAMAIGNPFSLSSTVTTGIVSALGRQTGGTTMYQNFIQTDAAINPGNSGGALVNIEGELIGINTMIYTRSGGYMGIGFAIPINMAKDIMEQIIEDGKVTRGWLGVSIADIDKNMREALGLKNKRGVLINKVFPDQPAAKAGIKDGDVVISIDGVKTKDVNTLRNVVAAVSPGKEVEIGIIRDGKEKTLTAVLAKRPNKPGEISSTDDTSNEEKPEESDSFDLTEKAGFKVGNITKDIAQELKLKDRKGAIVTEVNSSSRAAQKGLRQNDIIKKVKVQNRGWERIKSAKQLNKIFKKVPKQASVLIQVERGEQLFFLAFRTN